jgi:hypothetical protein
MSNCWVHTNGAIFIILAPYLGTYLMYLFTILSNCLDAREGTRGRRQWHSAGGARPAWAYFRIN